MMQHVVSTEILMRYSTCSLLHYNMRSTKIKAKLIFPSTLPLSQKILMYRRKRGYVVSHCAFTLYHDIQYYNSAKECLYAFLHVSVGADSNLLCHIRFHLCKHVARVCASVCYVAIWLYELPSVLCRRYPAVVPQNRSFLHNGRFNSRSRL